MACTQPFRSFRCATVSVRALVTLGLLVVQPLAQATPSIDLVRVSKSKHTLQLLAAGQVVREFRVSLGKHPKGHKQQEGDRRTPEGIYTLDFRKADSRFHRAIHISYPNRADVAAAQAHGVRPGGAVMIHGQKNGYGEFSDLTLQFDWTDGCIALANADMDVVWSLVPVGTKIEIKP